MRIVLKGNERRPAQLVCTSALSGTKNVELTFDEEMKWRQTAALEKIAEQLDGLTREVRMFATSVRS